MRGEGQFLSSVVRCSKRAVAGERREARWGAGVSMGWISGNCQPNGASGEGIGGAVAARKGRIWCWDHGAVARDLEFGPGLRC